MKRSLGILVAKYAGFAGIATCCNLAAQEVCVRLYDGLWQIYLSIFVGTLVGFAVKYVLDKWLIFYDRTVSAAREIRQVFLYGVTAVATTLVFWSFEFSFWHIWQTSSAKYTGAVIGLAIGYVAKYLLDRKFVFRFGES